MRPLKWVSSALAVVAAAAAAVFLFGNQPITPTYAGVRATWQSSEARLLDRHGEVIHELRIDEQGRRLRWTELVGVSPALIGAVVQAEDRRFHSHQGIDIRAVMAALWNGITGGAARGASTITMQLAALLDPQLHPTRARRGLRLKWQQMRAARAIEREWSKMQILEAYLNLVTFRGELQGIASASRGLFDKDPGGLTQPESLLLAALLRGPNADAALVARRACLSAAEDAVCTRVRNLTRDAFTAVPRIRQEVALAPHVARQLSGPLPSEKRKVIAEDRSPPVRSRAQGRLGMASTLDADLQRSTTAALRRQLLHLAGSNVRDGAVLVVDNASGDVLAYVGNADLNGNARYVDGVRAPRQAGSTLKPFLYALAIERKLLTAASLLNDSPVNLLTPSGLYVPQNYDREFRGWVSARTALAGSLNVPAVRALMLVGVDAFADRLRQMGFEQVTESGEYYGYSLALGSAEVTLWQLVNAYRTLAEDGRYSPLTMMIGEHAHGGQAVLDAAAAFIVSDVLADRAARSSSFGLDSPLATSFWSAVKTGTSKDMRDNWCIGYSRRYTVGVWVGNFDGEPMHEVSGVSGAAPVWAEVMQSLHRGVRAAAPAAPAQVVSSRVEFEPAIEAARTEWFIRGTEVEEVALNRTPARLPRIAYPGDGMTVAYDPDIPAGRQRMHFRGEPDAGNLMWRLDGEPLGAAAGGWEPRPGTHELTLLDERGSIVDRIAFVVRGRNR